METMNTLVAGVSGCLTNSSFHVTLTGRDAVRAIGVVAIGGAAVYGIRCMYKLRCEQMRLERDGTKLTHNAVSKQKGTA